MKSRDPRPGVSVEELQCVVSHALKLARLTCTSMFKALEKAWSPAASSHKGAPAGMPFLHVPVHSPPRKTQVISGWPDGDGCHSEYSTSEGIMRGSAGLLPTSHCEEMAEGHKDTNRGGLQGRWTDNPLDVWLRCSFSGEAGWHILVACRRDSPAGGRATPAPCEYVCG